MEAMATDKVDKGFCLSYWKLSYRRKFIRTLWTGAFIIPLFGLLLYYVSGLLMYPIDVSFLPFFAMLSVLLSCSIHSKTSYWRKFIIGFFVITLLILPFYYTGYLPYYVNADTFLLLALLLITFCVLIQLTYTYIIWKNENV